MQLSKVFIELTKSKDQRFLHNELEKGIINLEVWKSLIFFDFFLISVQERMSRLEQCFSLRNQEFEYSLIFFDFSLISVFEITFSLKKFGDFDFL